MKYTTPGNHEFVDFDNPVSDHELDKRDFERRQEKFYDDLITIIIRERLYRNQQETNKSENNCIDKSVS